MERNDIPLEPWYEDVYEIASLIRWLALRKELPTRATDIADLVENAQTWQGQYAQMRLFALVAERTET